MPVTTKRHLFWVLRKSRLLSSDQRVAARGVCQGLSSAAEAADRLVQSDLLTSWQAKQLLAGRTKFFMGKYKLLKLRGRGAMGIVFKAEHPELRRIVAVKVLTKSLLNKPRSVSRFLREIRSTAVLNHPNLVVAYDADAVGQTYCLVMEYISGKTLKALCAANRNLSPLWACECIRQAALGLQHIHERGLVHRDVKPSNLLVTSRSTRDRPQIKLLDVGLARFVSETEDDQSLTRDGQIVGTCDYMAPEQVAKARYADIRADIYGLGATLFFMLAGKARLAGTNLLQTYMNRLQNEAPPLSSLCRDVSPELDAIVAKMLKSNPDERYQTPAEVAAALADFLADAKAGAMIPTAIPLPSAHSASRKSQRPMAGRRFRDSAADVAAMTAVNGPDLERSSESLSESSLDEFVELMQQSVAEPLPAPVHLRSAAGAPEWLSALRGRAWQISKRLMTRLRNLRGAPIAATVKQPIRVPNGLPKPRTNESRKPKLE